MGERKISALIVDDESLGRDLVRNMLRSHTDIHVVAECSDGERAMTAIKRHAPELVFLDIRMPKLDGLAVLERLNVDNGPLVVFLTAYDAYAIQAFEAQALDYLLKPFDQERFDQMLTRVRRQLTQRAEVHLSQNMRNILAAHGAISGTPAPPITASKPAFEERLPIKESGRVFFVQVNEIDWLEASGNYVAVHVASRTHLVHETMASIEARLNPNHFVRIHRSTIVNVAQIKELHPHFNGEFIVLLKDGKRLKLSRGFSDKAKGILGLN